MTFLGSPVFILFSKPIRNYDKIAMAASVKMQKGIIKVEIHVKYSKQFDWEYHILLFGYMENVKLIHSDRNSTISESQYRIQIGLNVNIAQKYCIFT